MTGPPASCSYARDLLLAIGGFPEDLRVGEDTAVNTRLYGDGHHAWRSQGVQLAYRSRCTTARSLAAHHVRRGRMLGRLTRERVAAEAGLVPGGLVAWMLGLLEGARVTGPISPRRRARRIQVAVGAWGDAETRAGFERARGLIALGALAAWAGAWLELLRPPRLRQP